MTAMVKSSAQTEPSKFQKVTKYALFYSSINVFKISRTFFRAGYWSGSLCNNDWQNIHSFKG